MGYLWNIIHKYFLIECKYVIKNRKIINTTNEDLELIESDDEYDDE